MRRWSFASLAASAMLSLIEVAGAQSAPGGSRWPAASRIVVVPDVHGAYDELTDLLEATGIVGAELEWAGGDARLVSLGDLLDRGPDSRRVMDLLMRLEREAPAAGGRVHVLLGNHELMNLTGDLRYVSADEFAAFAAEESDAMREAAFAEYRARRPEPADDDEARVVFDATYPLGYFAHREAFAADGRYGSWLLGLPSLIVIGDTAFVHGGLPQAVAGTTADALNAQIAAELKRRAGDRDRQRDARDARDAVPAEPPGQDAAGTGVDGPQWYRGSVYCKPLLEEPVLDASLAALGAGRVIVGHTPTDDRRVRELYGGKLIMLDTGMLTEYYAGRPAALLIDRGDLRVQYVAPRERRPPEHGRPEAYGLTRLQLLTALAEGDVARDRAVRDGADGERRVTLSHGGRMLEAIFVQAGRAGAAEEELAAFAVDQLLRFDLVPPTVARALGSRDGALQLVYPDAVSEAQRRQDAIALADWCALEPQLQLLAAFDLLVANRAREADDVLFRPRYPELKAIDHERAFAGSRRLPPRLDDAAVAVPPPALASLEGLTQGSLERAAGRWLSERDIAAVLARRDALLDRLDGR